MDKKKTKVFWRFYKQYVTAKNSPYATHILLSCLATSRVHHISTHACLQRTNCKLENPAGVKKRENLIEILA